MLRRSIAILTFGLVAFCLQATAQKNELGVLVGGQFPQSPVSTLTFGKSATVQGNYARRIAHVPLVSAYVELPVIVALTSDISPSSISNLPRNYSALYVTPGLKIKLAPSFFISPYLLGGIGVARFRGADTVQSGAPNPATTNHTAVFDFGGGVDYKIAPFISLRGELRDLYSGLPNLNLSGLDKREHNLIVSAGLVLRF